MDKADPTPQEQHRWQHEAHAKAPRKAAGGLIYLAPRLGLPLGRLPGDIRIERTNVSCVIALGTSILLSVILTVVLNIIVRFLNK